MAGTSQFLSNDALWQELQRRVEKAKHVDAAVAYVGRNGAKLLKLKKGDRLVVDMSLAAVRQGVTHPKTIQTFMSRGVQVYSRAKLHAKIYIMDKALIVGSANVSDNSRNTLDEAAMLTTDAATIKRARAYFEQLCTEPVRKAYLDECIKEYRPPKFKAAREPAKPGKQKRKRACPAKLWIVAGLSVIGEMREAAQKSIDKREKQIQKKTNIKDELTWVRFPKRPAYLDALQVGDWVIRITDRGKTREVDAPAQLVVPIDKWTSPNGKEYDMLWLEPAPNEETMSWTAFRSKAKRITPLLDATRPKSKGIEDDTQADAVLRLWTRTGRVSKKSR